MNQEYETREFWGLVVNTYNRAKYTFYAGMIGILIADTIDLIFN